MDCDLERLSLGDSRQEGKSVVCLKEPSFHSNAPLVPNCPIKAVTSSSILQEAALICAGLGEPGGLLFSPILFFLGFGHRTRFV